METTVDAPAELLAALALLDDEATRIAVTAERAVLEGLDSGCQAPMAAHAELIGGDLRVRAVVYAPHDGWRIGLDVTEPLHPASVKAAEPGEEYIHPNGSGNGADSADGADPIRAARRIGLSVAHRLLERGAADLLPRP